MTGVSEITNKDELKLNQFKLDRILFNDSAKKTIGLLGKFENISDVDQGIVILEKLAFTEENFTTEVEKDSFLKNANLEEIFRNDIYGNYFCFAKSELNSEFNNKYNLFASIILKSLFAFRTKVIDNLSSN